MFKPSIFLSSLFLFLLISTARSQLIFAENNNQFSVSLVPNEFQATENFDYFDLLMSPNEKTSVSLLITNTGSENIRVVVIPTNATTNQQGEISYSRIQSNTSKEANLLHPFTSLVEKEQTSIIKPNESKSITFHLKTPETPFNGIILGGFVISIDEDFPITDNSKKEDMVFIKNKYEIRKAIRIRENKREVKPIISLGSIDFKSINNSPALTVDIRNEAAVMFGDISIESIIREKRSKKIIKQETITGLEMAPNSIFNFPIFWSNQLITKGDYRLNLKITSGSMMWNLNKDFKITKQDSLKFSNYMDSEKNGWSNLRITSIMLLMLTMILTSVIIVIKK